MELKIHKQRTCESCLAVSLIEILNYQKGINLDMDEEYNILFKGLKFTPLDFSTGQLVYTARKFPETTFEQYMDFEVFYNVLKKLETPENLKLYHRKIDLKFLKEAVKENPVIIYMDLFTLNKIYHFPHFVILKNIDDKNAIVLDPSSGEKVEMNTDVLKKSISHVRNNFKVCPKLIKIK